MVRRCWALDESDTLMARYHDEEWGMSVHDDREQFEFLGLDAFQAGRTILRRRAFSRFHPKLTPAYDARDVRRMLGDASPIRNRLKIKGTNASA